MIIRSNDIKVSTIPEAIKVIEQMPNVMAWARSTGRAGDIIEAIATHIIMTDTDYDTNN